MIANVEPGSRIITDGWRSYPPATRDLYEHAGTSVVSSGLQVHEVLPAVHRVFSLVKRWIMGTMQGSVSPEHVQSYFDEWVFGFNRRHSRSRGLLFYRLMTRPRMATRSRTRTYERPGEHGLHRRLRPPHGQGPRVWTSGKSDYRGALPPIPDPRKVKLSGSDMKTPLWFG